AAVEGRCVLAEHGTAHLQSLLEAIEALPRRRELKPEALVLGVVPGSPDAEDGPGPADDVEGRHNLGDQCRVAVGHAGDEGAELHGAGLCGQRAEKRVPLEHGLAGATQRREVPEVVHDPERAEPGSLTGLGPSHDLAEHLGAGTPKLKLGSRNPKLVMATFGSRSKDARVLHDSWRL